MSWGEDLWLIENGYKPCHIVDGQQRITTFVILCMKSWALCAAWMRTRINLIRRLLSAMKQLRRSSQNISVEKTAAQNNNNIPFGYEVDNPSAEYMKYKVFDEQYAGAVNETYYTKT